MRRLLALCLFAAPVLVIVSELLAPSLTESGTTSLATVEAHLAGLRLWIWLGMAAAGLVVASAMALLRLAPYRGRTLGVVGASLATVGALGYSAHQALFLQLPAMLHGNRAAMARLYERGSELPEVGILVFFVFLIPMFLGLLLLGIAARLDRRAPTWPAVVLGLAFLPGFFPIPFDAGLVSFALLLVGLWAYGTVVLRTSDEQWGTGRREVASMTVDQKPVGSRGV
jgi:hypothetical protein